MDSNTKTHLRKVVDNFNGKSQNEQVTMYLRLPRAIAIQKQRSENTSVQSLLIFQRMHKEKFSEYVKLYGHLY